MTSCACSPTRSCSSASAGRSFAEFGRAVAEERARVARGIHDGLSQYLFAVSTHATMLEAGAPSRRTLPRLKEAVVGRAAGGAVRGARALVGLGTAPFDAALRRYVEFLTADGSLEVELEIDPTIRLAPDEQIEIFRIVQEGSRTRASTRRTRAEVGSGSAIRRAGRPIRDDGAGFDGSRRRPGRG